MHTWLLETRGQNLNFDQFLSSYCDVSLFAPFSFFFSSPAQYCEWMRRDIVWIVGKHDFFMYMCFWYTEIFIYFHYVPIHALIPSYLSDEEEMSYQKGDESVM